jgi:hypothetical protein
MTTHDALKFSVQLTFWETHRSIFAIVAGARKPWQWTVSVLKNILFASALFFVFCLLLCGKTESYISLMRSSLLWGVLFFVVFTPAFLLIFPFLMLFLLVLTKRASFLRAPVVYSFFKDRIEIKTAASQSTVQWATLVMTRETKQRFLLYFQKYVAFVIPKRCFADEAEIAAFRELVRACFVGPTAFRR